MENNKKQDRIIWFDVLRGWFIWLALWHHWGQDVIVWYQQYFKETSLLTGIYAVHNQMIGHPNPTDWWGWAAGMVFVPWVNQIYLMMASFNLANRTQEEFSKVWKGKLYVFFLLFMFFLGEKFIISRNLGEALALYPLMTWMIILAAITLLYNFTGVAGVIFMFVLAMSQWVLPLQNLNIESWLQENFHPFMNFDAAPHFFAASGSFGFLLGYLYYHKPKVLGKYQWHWLILLGVGLFSIGHYLSPAFYFPRDNAYATEHLKAGNFWGTVEILGIQIVVLSTFLIFHLKNWQPTWKIAKFFEVIGIYSLTVFAFHQTFFIHMWMPIVTWYCAFNNQIIPNNIYFMLLSFFVYLGFVLFLKKTKLLRLIMRE